MQISITTRMGCICSFCLVAASHLIIAAQPKYFVTDLGNLGGNFVYVSAINNHGQVAGNSTTNATSGMHGFIYNNGGLLNLGTLGGSNSYCYSVNNNGIAVGNAYTPAGLDHGFVYQNGTMTDLGTLGGDGSDARAINDAGVIAGAAWTTNNAEYHACVFSNGTKTDLGTLGGTRSTAFGINNSGDVVGRASLSGLSPFHAFLYSQGVMMDLGTLGGSDSWANGINNAGHVVGQARAGNGAEHAFFYDGTMHDLNPPGAIETDAYAINNAEDIVGYLVGPDVAQHAFLYHAGLASDLNDLIDPASGWNLEIATAINDGGQIVGVGTKTNVSYAAAFLLTPYPVLQISTPNSDTVHIQFTALANKGYLIEYRDSLSSGDWQPFVVLDPITVIHPVDFSDPLVPGHPTRFYRVKML